MANKNIPNEQKNEMNELFRMIHEMESRTLDEDIESTILQYGGGNADYIPPEKNFNPDAVQANLADLLITPTDPMEEEVAEAAQQMAFLLDTDPEEAMTEDLPPPPEQRNHPIAVLGGFFADNFFRRGDDAPTTLRKGVFWLSTVALIGASLFLVSDLCVQPQQNIQLNNELVEMYRPDKEEVISNNPEVPKGTLLSFEDLYARNKEVSGWLSYHATGRTDFLKIEYPVMFSGDNLKYVHRDYDGKKNKNGTLFLDGRNEIKGYDDHDQSMIIYGHNMASGQMFAGLNKFIGSETNARTAATFTFSTLYRKDEYVVFAVALSEEAERDSDTYFNYYRTEFASGDQFLSYIQQVRERSLFDYPTDVRDDDTILILATCTGKTSAKLNDGRLLVFARRARAGEQVSIKTSAIAKNIDVIMPYSWYINQKMEPHAYYSTGILPGDVPVDGPTNNGDNTTDNGWTGTDDDTTTATDEQGNVITGVITPGSTTRPNGGNQTTNHHNGGGSTTGTVQNGGTDSTTQNGGGSTDSTTLPSDTTVPDADDSTTQPEDSTTQPEDSTTQPEDTTTQPEDTTTQPEETTTQPEETTTQAEETTTTAAPEGGDTTEG